MPTTRLLGLTALLVATAAAGCWSPTQTGVVPVPGPTVPGARPPAPPWAVPTDNAIGHVEAAGLEVQPGESEVYHIHAYLVVTWEGQPVTVPGNIGVDPNGIWISPLHTHGTDGVLHVEAPKQQTITLGQFFRQWNVSLGGAMVYDGGQPVADGANLALRDQQAIAVTWGALPARIPDRYPYVRATPAPAHPSSK